MRIAVGIVAAPAFGRNRPMRALIATIIVAPLVCAGLPALAQSNPSADQIINSLRPTGNLVSGGTRGIRLVAPTNTGAAVAPQTSQATQPRVASSKPMVASAAVPAPAPASAPSVNLTVNFATDSATLTPEAMRTLDELGRALSSKELAAYRFRIEGHTDTVGSRQYNQTLSERRAVAVVDYVAKKFGVDPSRLQAVGMGEDGLLVPTPAQTAEPRNRRVEVINVGA